METNEKAIGDHAEILAKMQASEVSLIQRLVISAVQGLCANNHVRHSQIPEIAISIAAQTVVKMASYTIKSQQKESE